MSWLYLVAAIIFEIAGTVSMKLSDGFTKAIPSILMILFYLFAFASLNFSLKTIPVSVAYAIWSAIGTAAIAVIGYLVFKETLTVMKVSAILLIIVGVVLLNIDSESSEQDKPRLNEQHKIEV
ncbi:MAG TPA: QacE family quaternary ammonium compound efflux SMR transporter [Bacillus bacterium]|uniref:QacE family quaternary ammonium compound efflux SMR transporter n=1 Tax=Siminovitchia fordii TaxID=254759 RepID=A0ABQ4K3H7_9BACI|nr:multidrug efflux SMR transporter [Siminovitchia fordii]GIN20186.1 QacE family quaternary ammonium compound efflux SMR transporter [Siminovitchia fordii]HBZ09257.1 QacE family quaternary ammonium compound efflux SMR transporter [Bacillus sp. (in: firmicutes)]